METQELRDKNLDRAVHLAATGRIPSEDVVKTAKEFDDYVTGTTAE